MNKELSAEEAATEELSQKFDFRGKMPETIRKEINVELFKQEKTIIFRLEEMRETIDKVYSQLNDLDNRYSEIQGIINQEATNFNKLGTDVETIENQRQMVETRTVNQQKLQETLNILLSGLQLSEEEFSTLKSPKFSSAEDLRRAEDAVEKVGKFLKFQVDKFRNMKLYQDQVDIMDQQLTIFTSLLKEDLQKVAKKSSLVPARDEDTGDKAESLLNSIDPSGYKSAVMQRRRLMKSLINAKSNSQKYVVSLLNSVKEGAKSSIERSCKQLEKSFRSQIERQPIIKNQCSFSNKLSVPGQQIALAESATNPNSLINVFINMLSQVASQIDLELNYWSKFFSFDVKKYTKEDTEIQEFVADAYFPLFTLLRKIAEDCSASSPIAAYSFLIAAKNYLLQKTEDEEEDEEKDNQEDTKGGFTSNSSSSSRISSISQKDDQPSSQQSAKRQSRASASQAGIMLTFVQDFISSINKIKNSAIKEYISFLEGKDHTVKYAPPFDESIVFADTFRLMLDLYGNYMKDNFDKDLSLYASKYLEWIQKESNKNEKYTNMRMITNLQVIMMKLGDSAMAPYKTFFKKISAAYKENQSDYCIYLFCYNFAKFSEMWFKIKEIHPTDWESEVPFKASKFVQSIESTFSKIDKEVEPIIKRMKKHFCKDQQTIQKQFEALAEFISEQYAEIEQLCMKVLKIKVTPSLSEVSSNLNKKKEYLA